MVQASLTDVLRSEGQYWFHFSGQSYCQQRTKVVTNKLQKAREVIRIVMHKVVAAALQTEYMIEKRKG